MTIATVTPIVPLWVIASHETGYTTGKPVTLTQAERGAAMMNVTFRTRSFYAKPYRPPGSGPVKGGPRRAA